MTDPAPLPVVWHACDLLTGNRLGELAAKPQGPLTSTLMRAEALTVNIATADLPDPQTWPIRTQAPQTMLVAEVGDTIVWGGIIWRRQHTPTAVVLDLLTCESLFDRRYVPVDSSTGYLTYPNAEQTAIIADLMSRISDYGFQVSVPPGEPSVRVQLVIADSDNKKISDVLTQLAGYLNGAEWTVQLAWADSTKQQVVKTLVSTFRQGTTPPNLPAPTVALFDQTQLSAWNIIDADWSDGMGATSVTAYSNSGVSGSNAYSNDHVSADLLAAGVPLLQERFSPAGAVTYNDQTLDTEAGLNGHAAGRLAEIGHGTRSITCSLAAGVAPLPNRDFALGDYWLIQITDARWANTQHFPVRVVSWSQDATSGFLGPLTPVFWSDNGFQGG